jgi:hypothetical protein
MIPNKPAPDSIRGDFRFVAMIVLGQKGKSPVLISSEPGSSFCNA